MQKWQVVPTSLRRSVRYDVNGNPIYVVDERANTTTYAYDKLNRMIETTNALDQTTTLVYDVNGNKVAEEDWLGNTTSYRYDTKPGDGIIIQSPVYYPFFILFSPRSKS